LPGFGDCSSTAVLEQYDHALLSAGRQKARLQGWLHERPVQSVKHVIVVVQFEGSLDAWPQHLGSLIPWMNNGKISYS
jgi:hypothetical protein